MSDVNPMTSGAPLLPDLVPGGAARARALIVPTPRAAVAVRVGTHDDLPFMDELQKKHSRAVGYFPTQQFAGYIEMGAVLIAHEPDAPTTRLGYILSRDRYLKRD